MFVLVTFRVQAVASGNRPLRPPGYSLRLGSRPPRSDAPGQTADGAAQLMWTAFGAGESSENEFIERVVYTIGKR